MYRTNLGRVTLTLGIIGAMGGIAVLLGSSALADTVGRLPGDDVSDKMAASGTMLKLIDTWVFIWGSKIIAGFFFLGSLWSFKEQRIGHGVICLSCAAACAFTPALVRNLFESAGGRGVLSQSSIVERQYARVEKVKVSLHA